jgi:hypothetical protein
MPVNNRDQEIPGCTDPEANNYNPDATLDNGSCEYDTVGCTDPEALNYNEDANILCNDCCIYEIFGCTDPEAENYDPTATEDDSSCEYAETSCFLYYDAWKAWDFRI